MRTRSGWPFLRRACWLTIYLLLPKPMWVYVFGHELTHALWTWLFGGRVKKFKAFATAAMWSSPRAILRLRWPHIFFRSTRCWSCSCSGRALALELAALPGLVSPAARRGLRLPRHLNWHILKHSQTDITRPGLSLFGRDYLLGNVAVLLGGHPAAGVEGGGADRVGLVAGRTGELCIAWAGCCDAVKPHAELAEGAEKLRFLLSSGQLCELCVRTVEV